MVGECVLKVDYLSPPNDFGQTLSFNISFYFNATHLAKEDVEKWLPGAEWEDQGSYLIVDLHQFSFPVVDYGGYVNVIDASGNKLKVFSIVIEPHRVNTGTGFTHDPASRR